MSRQSEIPDSERQIVTGIITAIRAVAGPVSVQLHEPEFCGREQEYVLECIRSGYVSSIGTYVDRFGQMLGDRLGAPAAVPTVNGTAALHLCLKLMGVERSDEVILPTLSFVATANAVSYCGAVPHFVDSQMSTLGLDAEKLGRHLRDIARIEGENVVNRLTGRRIAAIVPVHIFGHPVDMDPLLDLAAQWALPVIEDAAEALGSLYKGRPAGTIGRIAAFSFNGNKIVTTGGGGAVVSTDPALAARARHLSTTARVPHRWEFDHDEVGYNYRMPNLNAALGCAQLESLDKFVTEKRALAKAYSRVFKDLPGADFVEEPAVGTSIYWLNAILLDPQIRRDAVLEALNESGLAARPCWRLLSDLTPYRDCPRGDLAVAQDIWARLVNIPSSARLGRQLGEKK